MRITKEDRNLVIFYLKEFYKFYPDEKYNIFNFVRYFKDRLKNNKDTWMGVAGDTGTGKSLFVIISQILFGRGFDLKKNISYIPQGEEIIEKLDKLSFNTFLVDESAKQMRAVDWQNKSQQKVNTKAMTDRFQNNWVFLNMPNFNEFTKSMRNTNLQFRAIVLFRNDKYARIVIQMRSRNWRSMDRWYDKEADERYQKAIKRNHGELSNDELLSIERGLPNTIMDFIVPNLELIIPNITDEYERLKRESRNNTDESFTKEDKKADLYKSKYEILLERVTKILGNNELNLGEIKVTKEEMANSLNISYSTFNKYFKKPNLAKIPIIKEKINKGVEQ